MSTIDVLRRRQDALLGVLGCTHCAAPLTVEQDARHRGLVVSADLVCAEHGVVGVVDGYRPSFLEADLHRCTGRGDVAAAVPIPLDLTGPEVTWRGHWEPGWEGRRAAGDAGEELVIATRGTGVRLTFFANEHCGEAEITVDDAAPRIENLHRPVAELHTVEMRFPREESVPGGASTPERRIVVRATGARNPASLGTQVVVNRLDILDTPDRGPLPSLEAVNRGNGYPPRFGQLVGESAADAVIVDCGGGDRRFGDPRVFNLEYLRFELPDVLADGLALPFRSGSLDLVLSQAVLEHVPDPQQAIDEIIRVLKPGGLLYAEVAFMQPLHAVPSHYFNVTPHGLEHLCRDLETIELDWFTGLHDTAAWLCEIANAHGRIGRRRLDQVLETLRELDTMVPKEQMRAYAGSTSMLARKPFAGPPTARSSPTERNDTSEATRPAAGAGDLGALISNAQHQQVISAKAPTRSSRPRIGPAIGAAKQGIQRAISWNLQYVADQATGFGASITRALRVVQRRLDDHDRSLRHLTERVDDLEASRRSVGSQPASPSEQDA